MNKQANADGGLLSQLGAAEVDVKVEITTGTIVLLVVALLIIFAGFFAAKKYIV